MNYGRSVSSSRIAVSYRTRSVRYSLTRTSTLITILLYLQPNDKVCWDYDKAKKLCQYWFFRRAIRIVREGWPAAAAYYAYHFGSHVWDLAKLLRDSIAPRASTNHWCLHTKTACKAKKMLSISLKPAFRESLSIHGEGLETERQLSVGAFSSGKRTAQALITGGMEWSGLFRERSALRSAKRSMVLGLMKKTISIPACGGLGSVRT